MTTVWIYFNCTVLHGEHFDFFVSVSPRSCSWQLSHSWSLIGVWDDGLESPRFYGFQTKMDCRGISPAMTTGLNLNSETRMVNAVEDKPPSASSWKGGEQALHLLGDRGDDQDEGNDSGSQGRD